MAEPEAEFNTLFSIVIASTSTVVAEPSYLNIVESYIVEEPVTVIVLTLNLVETAAVVSRLTSVYSAVLPIVTPVRVHASQITFYAVEENTKPLPELKVEEVKVTGFTVISPVTAPAISNRVVSPIVESPVTEKVLMVRS